MRKRRMGENIAEGLTKTLAAVLQVSGRAIELSARAIEVDPTDPLGHIASCVSKGRLALFKNDSRAKVRRACARGQRGAKEYGMAVT